MNKTLYFVTASHPSPDYCFARTPVTVAQNRDGTFFANHSKLGCGRDYATADEAIRALFQAHACYVQGIEIV